MYMVTVQPLKQWRVLVAGSAATPYPAGSLNPFGRPSTPKPQNACDRAIEPLRSTPNSNSKV